MSAEPDAVNDSVSVVSITILLPASSSSVPPTGIGALVTNDNGTMVQVALSDVKTYLTSAGFSSEDPTALAIALG